MSHDEVRLIAEEFREDLSSLSVLVDASRSASLPAKVRVIGSHSATLLLASRFEEFVRQSARAFAKAHFLKLSSVDQLPPKFLQTAWRRSAEISVQKISEASRDRKNVAAYVAQAETIMMDLVGFSKGDFRRDIFEHVVHNENNMRPGEINGIFKNLSVDRICLHIASSQCVLEYFGEDTAEKCDGKLVSYLEDFFERRNEIAHALDLNSSAASGKLAEDIELFRLISVSIESILVGLLITPTT